MEFTDRIRRRFRNEMASDFATQSFTFKIDLAFNFEMKDKVQIDANWENGKSWKRLAQHLLKWPKSTHNVKIIDRFIDLLTRLSWAARDHLLSFFWWTLNEILNI